MVADGRRNEKIVLFTDSLSNVQNLASDRSKLVEHEDVLLRMLMVDVLELGNSLHMQFIRGHAGHHGNEW